MSNKLGISRDYRFIWKIILVCFWFTLFALITYFVLQCQKKIKKYLVSKKENLAKKKPLIIKKTKKVLG